MSFLNLKRKTPSQKSSPRECQCHQSQLGGRLSHPTPRTSALDDSKLDGDPALTLTEAEIGYAGGMNTIGRGLSLRAPDLIGRAASNGPGGGGGSCFDGAPAAQRAMGGMVGMQPVALLRDSEVIEEIAKEVMALKTNQLADLKELLFHLLNENKTGREVESSDDADATSSDQQQLMKDAVAAAVMKEEKSAATNNKTKKPRKQKKDVNQKILSLTLMMVAFGSIMMLIFSLSLIHESGGLEEGGASLTLPPPASRFHRKKKDQSNNDNTASPEIIISPLPASIVVPPPIFSPAAASNQGVKFDKLRSLVWTCFDTPNWVDKKGTGCDYYDVAYDTCRYADKRAGEMGPATTHCCHCMGGPRTVSRYIL